MTRLTQKIIRHYRYFRGLRVDDSRVNCWEVYSNVYFPKTKKAFQAINASLEWYTLSSATFGSKKIPSRQIRDGTCRKNTLRWICYRDANVTIMPASNNRIHKKTWSLLYKLTLLNWMQKINRCFSFSGHRSSQAYFGFVWINNPEDFMSTIPREQSQNYLCCLGVAFSRLVARHHDWERKIGKDEQKER